MGPCATCGAPGAFGFDPVLAGLEAKGATIWACPDHRAGLPGQGARIEMDELHDFRKDEHEDLRAAAAEMARFLKSQGKGEAVRAIGPALGYECAKTMLGTYFAKRAQRQNREHAEEKRRVPFE